MSQASEKEGSQMPCLVSYLTRKSITDVTVSLVQSLAIRHRFMIFKKA